jgi:hypothetical protein
MAEQKFMKSHFMVAAKHRETGKGQAKRFTLPRVIGALPNNLLHPSNCYPHPSFIQFPKITSSYESMSISMH